MAKQISLKIEKVEINGLLTDFSYMETIKTVMSRPGASGFSIEEVVQSVKIIRNLKTNGAGVQDNLKLEDADWEYLKKKFGEFRWGIAHDGIVHLRDAIYDAENLDI